MLFCSSMAQSSSLVCALSSILTFLKCKKTKTRWSLAVVRSEHCCFTKVLILISHQTLFFLVDAWLKFILDPCCWLTNGTKLKRENYVLEGPPPPAHKVFCVCEIDRCCPSNLTPTCLFCTFSPLNPPHLPNDFGQTPLMYETWKCSCTKRWVRTWHVGPR